VGAVSREESEAAQGSRLPAFSESRVIHPEQSARMRQSTRCRRIVTVGGHSGTPVQNKVQVTINGGRCALVSHFRTSRPENDN
jgi:hypothetical protein